MKRRWLLERRRIKQWALSLVLLFPPLADADIRLDRDALTNVTETSMLVISGNNPSYDDAILVIRADDKHNPTYADRANMERVIPPGGFTLQVPVASLRTPGGRKIELDKLRQVIIFPGKAEHRLDLEDATVSTPKPLGENVFAWDLGPAGSAIWPGFQPLTPDSSMIKGLVTGQSLHPIDRSARMQAADALTIDGIKGIDTLMLPLPAGKWQITLWLRDPGEWELLPHALKREIKANSQTVFYQNMTPTAWIENVYLGLQSRRVTPESSSWQHFGKRESDRVTFEVKSDGQPVRLSLFGDTPDARFISAVLAAPAGSPEVLEMLTRQRQHWWEQNWPISEWKAWPSGQPGLRLQNADAKAAPGTSVVFSLDFEQGNLPGAPIVILKQPAHDQMLLPAHWHWSQWQLTRSHLSSTLLVPNDDYLRHGILPENKGIALPRRLMIRVDVPEHQSPGRYQGDMQIMIQGKVLRQAFTVEVLDVTLPEMQKPVGIYLEKQVQFGWFSELAPLGDQGLLCDLTFLRKLGFTGVSPPFETPHNEASRQSFDSLSNSLNMLGFQYTMAYAPAKRLTQKVGVGSAASIVAEIESHYASRLKPTPYWSIADEPSNPGNTDLFRDMYRSFSMLAPNAKLAGHLNSRHDRQYLLMFDLVLVNDGFGIDVDAVKETKAKGPTVWLYNLPNPRAAAGFYLWHSGADGFLKWHGRMPTADPFDPTDGREFDVQMLYPSANPCPVEPDIHTDLYALMQGIVDYRWLMWLESKATNDVDAARVFGSIKRELPNQWHTMRDIDNNTMDNWRKRIMKLAQ